VEEAHIGAVALRGPDKLPSTIKRGIFRAFVVPRWGTGISIVIDPRAAPWAILSHPFGVRETFCHAPLTGTRSGEAIMPQSLANVLLHIIFSTKNREPHLRDRHLRDDLHAYLAGTLANLGCPALIVGGVSDHVHILCQLSRTTTIADLVQELKTESSKWLKERDRSLAGFYWQNGYAALSVSQSNAPRVRDYIAAQEEHHRTRSFQDEFREFLRRHKIEFDERYVWD
jgi:putative transposase